MGAVAGAAADRRPRLVARAQERALIGAFIAALPGGARTLSITGEPGIGKTALWRLAIAECERAGFGVVLARPAQEDMPLALAGLVDLFERAGVDVDALLAEDSPFARGRAVLAALRELSAERPVVIAIDDVQWLDPASARALRYALRRLDREPVGLLATLRSTPAAEDPLAAADALPPGRAEALELAPLGVEALRRVLATAVDAISRPALHHIHAVSGGNPLFALELARGMASSTGGLRLPRSLQAAIAHRLEAVTPEHAALLGVVAATGPTSVSELRATAPDADALLAEAVRQELLVVDDDLGVRFAHPLIGSVVYDRMGPLVRRELHARLAACAADADVRARHLARSTDEPCPRIAQLLEDAAERARARGALDLAAEFAGHSARLTPRADAAAALRRGLAEIDDVATAGEVGRALALSEALIAVLPAGPGRAEALLIRASLEDDGVEIDLGLARDAVEQAGTDDLLRARALSQLGWTLGMFGGDLRAGIAHARTAAAMAEGAGDRALSMTLDAELAYLEGLGGAPRPELMARALALEAELGKPNLWTSPRTFHAELLLWSGDLPGARAVFEAVREECERSRTELHQPYCMFDLALVAVAAGELRAAERFVHEGIEAARDAEDTWGERLLLYPLALVDAWRGRADRARAVAARRLAEAQRTGERPGVARARGVLGLVALSEGDSEAAARELAPAAALLEEIGFVHPGAFPVLPDAIEALACSGDLPAAEALLARLERGAASTSSPWARAASERCRGVLLLAAGDADAAVAPLADAAQAFDQLGYAADAARAVLAHGRALLRGGLRSRASDAFADARRRFAAIGAPLWEARAVEELERVAPGRSRGALTPAERRVADLVAEGMRNREIGRTLYMSVGTVEAHLTRIYRKLGIRCRSELARLVAQGSLR